MATVEQVLEVARAELGTVESPPGSNRVKYNDWYGLGNVSWCAIFVSWVADRAGATDIIPRHAWTPSGALWFKRQNRWGVIPRVGAIVYYNIGGLGRISHVGIVEQVHPDGSWTAIEGNTDERGGRTGGKVMRQHRRVLGRGGGFGYPDYENAPVENVVSPAPVRDVEPPLLRRGSKGAAVVALQRRLMELGFALPRFGADGDFGAETEKAVLALQEAAGIERDGIVGKDTRAALERGVRARRGPAYPGFLVRRGQRSHHVREVQARLRELGYRISVDGIFGPRTEAAVENFQRRRALGVDGIVGPKTWAALW